MQAIILMAGLKCSTCHMDGHTSKNCFFGRQLQETMRGLNCSDSHDEYKDILTCCRNTSEAAKKSAIKDKTRVAAT